MAPAKKDNPNEDRKYSGRASGTSGSNGKGGFPRGDRSKVKSSGEASKGINRSIF